MGKHCECIYSHWHTTFGICKQTQTHPQSLNSINIQGESSVEWACVSAALTSKTQRERERMAEKSKKETERKWQRDMERNIGRGGWQRKRRWGRRRGWKVTFGYFTEDKLQPRAQLWQAQRAYPHYSWTKTHICRACRFEELKKKKKKKWAAVWIRATMQSQHEVWIAVITFVKHQSQWSQ